MTIVLASTGAAMGTAAPTATAAAPAAASSHLQLVSEPDPASFTDMGPGDQARWEVGVLATVEYPPLSR